MIYSACSSRVATLLATLCAGACLLFAEPLSAQPVIDPGCEAFQAWVTQGNPRSDANGFNNHWFPEYNATYWLTPLSYSFGATIIKGQYPRARYMSFQVYSSNLNVGTSLHDVEINPDPGQNNPFRSGVAQGTYTVRVVFGRQPEGGPAPNTLYTGGIGPATLFYRVYYPNDPDNLPGGPVNPVLPNVTVNGVTKSSCPPRPVLVPEEAALVGRLNDIDYVGTPPRISVRTPLLWLPYVNAPYIPFNNQDNTYLATPISREWLSPPYNYDMVVIHMKTPTFTDTQAGTPPYASAQTRYWSICQNELGRTSSVVQCVPDNQAATINGFATFVISDPSKRPSEAVLQQWGAKWLPWGALQPNDVIYSVNGEPLTNASGVFYYGLLVYRQLNPDPNFAESIANISKLPLGQRRAAMGDYWPATAYCKAAEFQAVGPRCIPSD
jgi:hypothetical protein